MKKVLSLLVFSGVMAFNSAGVMAAGNVHCSAKVSNVQLKPEGRVVVSTVGTTSGGHTQPLDVSDSGVCKLTGSTKEYCQALYSALLVALSTDQKIELTFYNGSRTCPQGQYQSLDSSGLNNFKLLK
ncbi:hypothetical protein [Pseudoalteromonas rubra]|uniref:Uncharacterized protein n=1 Tax=Pseudoalteromonas rubra TaxID=43658 RepID=A0A0F4QXB1_9GAMM|nr:hypothetical protein [Pseudoalteromonas rubra]KJZ12333.1 hypothetical protein TW77_02920 [Pseudoalteromonas rubra]